MPHIHQDYDFVVSVFIVHQNHVLLIYHKNYKRWLPIGGHIELEEDPEEALFREIKEESGLEVEILSGKPDIAHPGVKPILRPAYVDVHEINEQHKHIAFVYFAIARDSKVTLHEREHLEFRWLSQEDLSLLQYGLSRSIYFYCIEALKTAADLIRIEES